MRNAALVLYSNTDFGGAERRLVRIYNELGKSNKCDIIVRGAKLNDFYRRLEKADCDVSNIHRIIAFKSNILCLLYLLVRGKYNALHYFDLCVFNRIVARMLKLSATRTLLTLAYQNYAYGLIEEKTKSNLSRLINLSDRVDVLFPAGRDYFRTISTNKNISVTPGTFTNIELFHSKKKERLVLFAAARLEKDKNAILLIEACNICKEMIRKLRYKIYVCGKGFEEEVLKEKIVEYKIEDIIKMPGYIQTSVIMPKTEIFINIDLIDNYPSQTIAEATACGCTIICTDVGYSRMCGMGEFIHYIKNDPMNLAELLIRCMNFSDKEKKQNIENATRYAKQHYNIKKNVEYFGELLWS